MRLKPSMSRPGLFVLPILIAGGATHVEKAAAASQEFPSASCASTFDYDSSNVETGMTYVCPISVPAATESIKVVVYFRWDYQPSGTTSGKPFDSSANCRLQANDVLGEQTSIVTASVTFPVTKAVSSKTGQLSLPTLPTLNGGYILTCTMPINEQNAFTSVLTAFKGVTQ